MTYEALLGLPTGVAELAEQRFPAIRATWLLVDDVGIDGPRGQCDWVVHRRIYGLVLKESVNASWLALLSTLGKGLGGALFFATSMEQALQKSDPRMSRTAKIRGHDRVAQ
jgi:hypothetical protein